MAYPDARPIRVIRDDLDVLGLSVLLPQPYDCNPSAQERLEKVHRKLLKQTETLDGPIVRRSKSCLAAVCYLLGRIYYDADGEPALAESMFLKGTTIVENQESEADNVLSVISCLNMLAYINMQKNNENLEEALRYLLKAQSVYENYSELKSGPATHASLLMPMHCPKNKFLLTNRNPLVGARLFTLFYIVDVYKARGKIDDAVISTHLMLKIQLENNLLLQSPLDWAQCSAVVSNFFSRQNAYESARNHLATSSTFIEKILPEYYAELCNTETYRQLSADVARCWSIYGLELLNKSRARYLKEDTQDQASTIFNGLLFKNFEIWNEEHVTKDWVNNYDEAVLLVNNILMNINRTKKYYTFEKFDLYYADLCTDELTTYKLLADFQSNLDKKGKLYKRGVVSTELTALRLEEKDCLTDCKRMWFDLATMYYNMMEIKYDRHVLHKPELTESASKMINQYSDSAVTYYLKLVGSFKIGGQLSPQRVRKIDLEPLLQAYLNMGKCYEKKIVYSKKMKVDNLLQSQKYYQTIVDYSQIDSRLAGVRPLEVKGCDVLARSVPRRIKELLKNQEPAKFY